MLRAAVRRDCCTQGASYLYNQLYKPTLLKYQDKIDLCIERLQQALVSRCVRGPQLQQALGVRATCTRRMLSC